MKYLIKLFNSSILTVLTLLAFNGCKMICVNGIKCSLKPKQISAEIKYYEDSVKKKLDKKDTLLTILHQLGNSKDYPKFTRNIKRKKVFNSTEKMITCFDNYEVDGVEFDVQFCDDTIYIIHEPIPLKYKTKKPKNKYNFFKNNLFYDLIDTFVKRKYYEKNKFLYIEFKAKNAYKLSYSEILTIKKTIEVIDSIIKKNKVDASRVCSQIAFVSFNHCALNYVIDIGIKKYKLYYILGHKCISKLCKAMNNAVFNKDDKKHVGIADLLRSKELAGIWFSPKSIKNIDSISNDINKCKGVNSNLEFFVSTYQQGKKSILKFCKKDENVKFKENIKGLIFNVRKKEKK